MDMQPSHIPINHSNPIESRRVEMRAAMLVLVTGYANDAMPVTNIRYSRPNDA